MKMRSDLHGKRTCRTRQKCSGRVATLVTIVNHFCDIVSVSFDGREWLGVLTHSGSRGAGHRVAAEFSKQAEQATSAKYSGIPKDYGWLELNTYAGQEYFRVMNLLVAYASANHDIIHKKITDLLQASAMTTVRSVHNTATLETHYGENGVVHRKGATPAGAGQLGVIPGTCGTLSYVVQGLGHPLSLRSASHGAGRPFSRSDAKRRFDREVFEEAMEGILHHGVAPDEAPSAYKNSAAVMEAQDGKLVDVVATLRPLVVVMGGNVQSDDGD
jgi:tRNA-splicing ligase RtcB